MFKFITTKSLLLISLLLPITSGAQGCDSSSKLCNPLQVDSITAFLGELIGAITYLSIPVIVFFIIYSGFLFVTAGGDTGKIETAKKTALYTVIGAAIILGADLLSDILTNTATNLGVDNFE